MRKITVLVRDFKRGIILNGPSPVTYAFDDAHGDHGKHGQKRESTHLALRHGVNEDIDQDEIEAWVKRAADHGLKFERLTDAYVLSDGRQLAADAVARQQASVLERALNCHATVRAR
jgi:hypothetical protein